ncbi:MAG: hypothetical protein QG639_392, partial [Patescibacteria group bacterium]|nr:hypothetical protein [Patescibacteria group bacterium]
MIQKLFSYINYVKPNAKGSLLVEVLVVMGLMGLLLPALIGAIITTKQGEVQRDNRIQAIGLLR